MTEEESSKGRLAEREQGRGIPFTLFGISLLLFAVGSNLGGFFVAAGHALLIAALIIYLIRYRSWPLYRPFSASTWCLILLVLFSAVSILANTEHIENPLKNFKKLRYLILGVLMVITLPLTQILIRNARWRKFLFLAWLGTLAISVTGGMLAYLTDFNILRFEKIPLKRVSGVYGQVMTFAYGLQFSILILGAMFWNRRDFTNQKYFKPVAVLIVLLIAGTALYFSFTRGAVLGLLVGVTVFAVLRSRKILLIVLAAALVLTPLAWMSGTRYFETLKSESIRLNQWRAASLTFLDHPLAGVGYRNFEVRCAELKIQYQLPEDNRRYPKGHPLRGTPYFNSHAHNNYLEAFASTGVFGGLAFLGFCFFWTREMYLSKQGRSYFLPLISAFLVSGLFENTFTDSELLSWILFLYFVSQVLIRWEKGEDEDSMNSLGTAEKEAQNA